MGKGTTDTSSEMVAQSKRRSGLAGFFIRLFKEKPLGSVCGVITLLLVLIAIFAEFIAPYGINETHVTDFLAPPSVAYPLGGDHLGRDVFSRIVMGARVSITVAFVAATLGIIVATLVGGVSGYVGGKFDMIVQRVVEAWMSIPGLVVLIILMALMGPGLVNVIVVLALSFGISTSRVIRSAVIGVKENVYVQAAVAVGCSTPRILTRHILPNIIAPILVLYTHQVPDMILNEAGLSFLGFGVPPPTPSWGGMLSLEGRTYMFLAPGLAIWPGVALSIVVFSTNLFGDAVRDLLDPRLRGGLGGYKMRKPKEVSRKK